jgi:glycosyltransferase involved in cell wall biosynthesis
MRVAVVHDWLNGMRGGEKVLEAILELYPQAVIYTLFHEPGRVSQRILSHRIITSWLDRIPGVYRHYRNLLPLFPAAVESWDLSGYDLVISSSHAVAKGVRTGPATHVCYCHTPMRYVWDAEDDYAFNAAHRLAMHAIRGRLRRWDCEKARQVDRFVANSRFVRDRIRKYYGRDAVVIQPPIDTNFFTPGTSPTSSDVREDFYLVAGALVPYKRVDLVIDAFNQLGHRLVVAGSGPALKSLRQRARGNIDNVEFRGFVTDDELRRLYRSAKGLVMAAREDFGMVAVEAQACGCPVIAFGAGGGSETTQDGINGVLFAEQQVDDIVRAARRLESMTWPVDQVRRQVETFSRENFQVRFRKLITESIGEKSEARGRERQPA